MIPSSTKHIAKKLDRHGPNGPRDDVNIRHCERSAAIHLTSTQQERWIATAQVASR